MSSYSVGGIGFETKKELTDYVGSILRQYSPGQKLSGHDFAFIHDLLNLHPRSQEKIGSGIESIVATVNHWKNHAFELIRKDGTRTDFSYIKCIYPAGEYASLKAACRTAIRPDIVSFRRRYFLEHADQEGKIICPLTYQKIGESESHVDHIPPVTFNFIFLKWLPAIGDPNTVSISGFEDGAPFKKFSDPLVEQNFREHHASLAQLRVVSPRGNLSESKRRTLL